MNTSHTLGCARTWPLVVLGEGRRPSQRAALEPDSSSVRRFERKQPGGSSAYNEEVGTPRDRRCCRAGFARRTLGRVRHPLPLRGAPRRRPGLRRCGRLAGRPGHSFAGGESDQVAWRRDCDTQPSRGDTATNAQSDEGMRHARAGLEKRFWLRTRQSKRSCTGAIYLTESKLD